MCDKRFVYILHSDADPDRHYVGITSDVEERLHWHNHGPSGVTVPHRPWSLLVALQFDDPTTAWRFERYSNPAPAAPSRSGAINGLTSAVLADQVPPRI
jgi:predicted GIY-YIG superfamily endonuclease